MLEDILPVKIISINREGELDIDFDKEFLYDFSGDTEWLGRAKICGYCAKEAPIIWIDSPGTSMISFWATVVSILKGASKQIKTQYLFKKRKGTFLRGGKSAFIGYQNNFAQDKTDILAQRNISGRAYRFLDIKDRLIDLIGKDGGRIYLGPGGCYTDLLRRILSVSFEELAKRGVDIVISDNFGGLHLS